MQLSTEIKQNIDVLALRLESAKEIERRAKEERITAEEALSEVIKAEMDSQTTVKTQIYRIVVKAPLRKKLDVVKYHECVEEHIPIDLRPVIPSVALDKKKYKALEKNHKELFILMASCVESKPAKVAVTVERIENGN